MRPYKAYPFLRRKIKREINNEVKKENWRKSESF